MSAKQPSAAEVTLLALTTFVALAATLELIDREAGYWSYANGAGDTFTYQQITAAIRRGDVASLREVKHFWGVAYLAAAVGAVTRLSDQAALLVVSAGAAVLSTLLVRRLWNGWIAAFFAVLSWDWIQASALGGSETAFTALVFAGFLAVREEHWALGSLAAAASACVRPAGVFALGAIVLVTAWRGDFRRSATAVGVGAAVAGLYLAPLWISRGDVWAHVQGYRSDWIDRTPLGIPLLALWRGMLEAPTWFAVVRPSCWIAFVLAGSVATALREDARACARRHPVETTFAAIYAAFLFSYNAEYWAWSEFPRFAIPLVPFALSAFDRRLILDRRLPWLLAPVSGALTAGWVVGFHHAWRALHDAR